MADVSVNNSDVDLSGKTLLTGENAYSITGLHTFNRSPSAPFAVQAGSATVANLDAALLNAQLPSFYLNFAKFTVVTITATGTQNDYAPGFTANQPLYVICNNASNLTITGVAGGAAGQHLIFLATNSTVTFSHSNGGSAAANRFNNRVTSGDTVIAIRGFMHYIHSGSGWNLIGHDQGTDITPTYAGGNFTGSGSLTWTVESGDVGTNRFRLIGNRLFWSLTLNTTSTGGTASTELRATLPQGYTAAAGAVFAYARCQNAGAAFATGMLQGPGGVTYVSFFADQSGTTNWSNAAVNNTAVAGQISVEVT